MNRCITANGFKKNGSDLSQIIYFKIRSFVYDVEHITDDIEKVLQSKLKTWYNKSNKKII